MLASMSGATFLAIYVFFALGVLAVAWVARVRLDPTRERAVDESALTSLSPADLAFMRGGVRGIAEFTLMDLVGRGYLTAERYDAAFASRLVLARAEGSPKTSYLAAHERAVLATVSQPRSVRDVLDDVDTLDALAPTREATERRLQKLDWALHGEPRSRLLTLDAALIGALILGVGVKALVGAPDGSAGINAALVVCVLAGLGVQWRVAPGRLSDLGTRAFKQIRRMHTPLRARIAREDRELADGQLATVAALFDASLLAPDTERAHSERS